MGKFVIRNVPSGVKFDLLASNGQAILTSEVYSTEVACRKGVDSVIRNASEANLEDQTRPEPQKVPCPKFELYHDKAGAFRFRLKATNGQIIGVSESYKAKASCENGIHSVMKNVLDAEVIGV